MKKNYFNINEKDLKEEDYTEYLKYKYKLETKKNLNIKNPKLYSEKIQWLKIFDNPELKTIYTDKIEVRNFIKDKIGEEYLKPIFGIWNNFDDINFNILPDSFFLKSNHGSGMYNLIKNKKEIIESVNKKEELKEKFDRWLKINYAFKSGLELQYKNILPKIFAEKIISEKNGLVKEYQIYCFNGKPQYINLLSFFINKEKKHHHTIVACGMYDKNWNKQNFDFYSIQNFKVEKPKNLIKMIEIAENLSNQFKFVRVDLVDINNNVFFSELTFSPYSGFVNIKPYKYEKILGDLIEIKQKTNFGFNWFN